MKGIPERIKNLIAPRKTKKKSFPNRADYYEMQRINLEYPNEEYIQAEENINQADKVRMDYVFKDNSQLTGIMLDVGCNDGFFARTYPWKFTKIIALDMYSIEEYTRGDYSKNPSKYSKDGLIEFNTGLVEDQSFEIQFDFIFAGEVIEHVIFPKKLLTVLTGAMKTDGVVVLTTPNDIGANSPEHFRSYSIPSLKKELEVYFLHLKIEIIKTPGDSWDFIYAKCSKPK